MCDYQIGRQIGYDIVARKCKRVSKWRLTWKTTSGTYSKNYCNQHKIIRLKDINEWDVFISLKRLK